MKRLCVPTLLLVVAALAGCSAVGKMSVETDNAAKQLVVSAEEALVYVVRPTSLGKAVKMRVVMDNEVLGSTGGKRYLFATVEPGQHRFVSHAENESELPITLEAGQTYYLEQKVKMGIMEARNSLERLSDAEGREKLAKCSLSNDNRQDVITGERKRVPARLVEAEWTKPDVPGAKLAAPWGRKIKVTVPQAVGGDCSYEFLANFVYNTLEGGHPQTSIVSSHPSLVDVASAPGVMSAGKGRHEVRAVFVCSCQELASMTGPTRVEIRVSDEPTNYETVLILEFERETNKVSR